MMRILLLLLLISGLLFDPGLAQDTTSFAFTDAIVEQAEERNIAAQQVQQAPEPTVMQTTLLNVIDLAAFFDGLIPGYLEAYDIAGAVVSVVKDDSLFFAKGYGYADQENKVSVRPDQTLFRIGSISKLFVWTTIMQLVEEGYLDLDQDISTYLSSVSLDDRYDQPITLKHLMTHTAGFEDYLLGLFSEDPTSLKPLEEILIAEQPARVRPPGEVASYSNHGTALAAYIAETIVGKSWIELAENRIIKPLGLTHTTFRQPLPDSLKSFMSKGYSGASFQEERFEFVPLAPVGAGTATAHDMARFMRAHLNHGQLDSVTILDSSRAALMYSPAFRHAPSMNSSAYGFYELSRNGYRMIGHGGDTFWFHSLMALIPEKGVGFFISFNSEAGGGKSDRVLDAFMDRYYPETRQNEGAIPTMAASQLERFAGTYRSNRFPHQRLTKIAALMNTFDVEVTEEGTLKTTIGEETKYWSPIDDLSFQADDPDEVLAFRAGPDGKITHLFMKNIPVLAFERVGLTARPPFHGFLFATCMGIFLLTLLLWPFLFVVRYRYGHKIDVTRKSPVTANLLAWMACAVFLTFVVGNGHHVF